MSGSIKPARDCKPNVMSFLANIEWRRAVKSFQSAKTSETEPDIEPILQAAINAPSSFGLQPWKIIVVSHHALKEKLAPVMYKASSHAV